MENLLLFWTGLVLVDYFFPFKLDQHNFFRKNAFFLKFLYFLLIGLLGLFSIFKFNAGWYVLVFPLILTGIHQLETRIGSFSSGKMAGIHFTKIATAVLIMFLGGFS